MCPSENDDKEIIGYLTHDIFDAFGRLLLTEGSPLTQDMIDKLDNRGICFRTAKTSLGLSSVVKASSVSDSTFTVPKQLDKKFDRLDMVTVGSASNYLSSTLQFMQEDFFLSSNIKALSMKHRKIYSHSINVGIIAAAIAEKMNLSRISIQEITIGALLHDVGKMLLPTSAFKDDSRYCAEQGFLYQQHPILGANLLATENLPKSIYLTVRQHHEKYSGGGYPDAIQGREIHINSCIVSVADVFDRLTTSSNNESALSPNEAIEKIVLNKGGDFHPNVVDLFVELFKRK